MRILQQSEILRSFTWRIYWQANMIWHNKMDRINSVEVGHGFDPIYTHIYLHLINFQGISLNFWWRKIIFLFRLGAIVQRVQLSCILISIFIFQTRNFLHNFEKTQLSYNNIHLYVVIDLILCKFVMNFSTCCGDNYRALKVFRTVQQWSWKCSNFYIK